MDEGDISSPQLRPRQTTATVQNVGKFRLISDLEPIEVTYILLAFVSIAGASIITIVRIKDSPKGSSDFTFAVLLLINLVFVFYYIIHGVFRERPFELLVSVGATLVVMIYCIVEFSIKGYKVKDVSTESHDLKLGRIIVVSVIGPIDIFLGLKIALKFYSSRSLIFKTVGGNAALQSMCQTLFIFTAFLKFDFQLVISLLVLILNGPAELKLYEKVLLGLGVPFSFLWVIAGFIMARKELLKLTYVFWLFGVLEPAYIIWLFVRVSELKKKDEILLVCTIAAGVTGLIIRAVVFLMSYLVRKNYNKGLKEKVYGSDPASNIIPSQAEEPESYDSIPTQ